MTPRRAILLTVLGAAALGLARLSIVTIKSGERGLVQRFGAVEREVLPGIHLKLPWPIETVRKADVQRAMQMPIGFRLVDELNGVQPTERMKQWLTGDTNIVELKATIHYRIASLETWIYGVSGVATPGDGGRESRAFALRRLGEDAITGLVAELTVDEVLATGDAQIQETARRRIQDGADRLGLGVEISSIEVLDAKPPAGVARSFTDVQDARSDRGRVINQAMSKANNILASARTRALRAVQEATADRNREIATARGRGEAFSALHGAIGSVDSPSGRKMMMDKVLSILDSAEVRTVIGGSTAEPTRVLLRD